VLYQSASGHYGKKVSICECLAHEQKKDEDRYLNGSTVVVSV